MAGFFIASAGRTGPERTRRLLRWFAMESNAAWTLNEGRSRVTAGPSKIGSEPGVGVKWSTLGCVLLGFLATTTADCLRRLGRSRWLSRVP